MFFVIQNFYSPLLNNESMIVKIIAINNDKLFLIY